MAGGVNQKVDYFKGMEEAIKEATQMQVDAAQKAMDIQQQQFNESLAFVKLQYNNARNDVAPYREMGSEAVNAMYDIMGMQNPNTPFKAYTALQERMKEMQGDINANAGLNAILGNNPTGPGGWQKDEDRFYNPASRQGTPATSSQLADLQRVAAAVRGGPQDTFTRAPIAIPHSKTGQSLGGKTISRAEWEKLGKPSQYTQNSTGAIDFSKIENDPELMAIWKQQGLPDFTAAGRQQGQLQAIRDNPDYKFRFEQGMNAAQNSVAAKGSLDSGSTLKGLQEYGEGMAAASYGDRIRNLMNLVTSGQNAATFSANQAMQQGQQVAGMRSDLADNLGSGAMAQGNALAHGLIGAKRWGILSDAVQQQNKNNAIGAGFGLLGNVMGMMGGGGGGMGMQKGGKAKKNKPVLVGEPKDFYKTL